MKADGATVSGERCDGGKLPRLTLVFEFASVQDLLNASVSVKEEFKGGKIVACMFDDALLLLEQAEEKLEGRAR